MRCFVYVSPKWLLVHVWAALALSALVSPAAAAEWDNMFTWKEHPWAHVKGMKPEILKSYLMVLKGPDGRTLWRYGGYFPRSSRYSKFEGADLLVPRANYGKLILLFNRPVKVVALLTGQVAYDLKDKLALPGWQFEGEVSLPGDRVRYKLGGGDEKYTPVTAYAFTKVVTSGSLIFEDLTSLKPSGFKMDVYTFLFLESNGERTKPPRQITKAPIYPNAACTYDLHKAYSAKKTAFNSQGGVWMSYHPQIDPIYWCYFGHEHGSYTGKTLKYFPTLHRTAWFNHRQIESHAGFKGYELSLGRYKMFTLVHAHVSRKRRFFEQFHTTVHAVFDSTGNPMMELSCKADFGISVANAKWRQPGAFSFMLPIGPKNTHPTEEDIIRARGARRIFNVFGKDPRIRFKEPKTSPMYEVWRYNIPNCAKLAEGRPGPMLEVDIQQPYSGRKSLLGPKTEAMHIYGFASTKRDFVINDYFSVGETFCSFKNGDVKQYSRKNNGFFYTDPYCKELRPGPCKTCIKQYLRPGFSLAIPKGSLGSHHVINPWTVEYGRRTSGPLQGVPNVEKRLNPAAN